MYQLQILPVLKKNKINKKIKSKIVLQIIIQRGNTFIETQTLLKRGLQRQNATNRITIVK